jgi:hypothetical protein
MFLIYTPVSVQSIIFKIAIHLFLNILNLYARFCTKYYL